MLRKYETVFVLRPDLPDEEMERVHTRTVAAVTENGGLEIAYQDWGKKRMAYPIQKSLKGNYIYFRYLSDGRAVNELERQLKVMDPVLRHITVKLADRIEPASFDFEADRKTIFPFGIKQREPERLGEGGAPAGEEGQAAPAPLRRGDGEEDDNRKAVADDELDGE